MHKIFAKTLFLGKNVVFLPQCHSTNEEAKALSKSGRLQEGSVIWTDYQLKGRGQQGNAWLSEAGKNLLFTVTFKPEHLKPSDQFLLNMVSSLALLYTIRDLLPTDKVAVKWPNDLYVNGRKIAGILIETTVSQSYIDQVYAGIGLNVNQSHFHLPHATSLKLISEKDYNRQDLLESILIHLESLLELAGENRQRLFDNYHEHLMWLGETRSFSIDNQEVEGAIKGINEQGKLQVLIDGRVRNFAMQEIAFLS